MKLCSFKAPKSPPCLQSLYVSSSVCVCLRICPRTGLCTRAFSRPGPKSASAFVSAETPPLPVRLSLSASVCVSASALVSANGSVHACFLSPGPKSASAFVSAETPPLPVRLSLSVSVYVSASVFLSANGSVHACFLSPRAEILMCMGVAEPGRRPLKRQQLRAK